VFKGGLTIVATGAEIKPLDLWGADIMVGEFATMTGALAITRSGSGNVWTQNALGAGTKLAVAGDLTVTANSITANEILLFVDASELITMGDVTLTATSLADCALQVYNGGSFINAHNVKALSISLGSTAVEAIKVGRQSSFMMANDVILEGTAAAVLVDEGSQAHVFGDLLLGNTTEQSVDLACLQVLGGSKVSVTGAFTAKRDASSVTSNLVQVQGAGSSLDVGGATLLDEDTTTGSVSVFQVEDGATATFAGTSTFNSTLPDHVIWIRSASVVNFVGAYVLSQNAVLSANCGLIVEDGSVAVFSDDVTSTITGGDAYWGGHLFAIYGGHIEVAESATVALLSTSRDVPGVVAYGAAKVNLQDSVVFTFTGGKGGGNQPSIWAAYGGLVSMECGIPTLVHDNSLAPAFQADYEGRIRVDQSIGTTSFTAASANRPVFEGDEHGVIYIGGNVTLASHTNDDLDIGLSQGSEMRLRGSFTTTTSATTGKQINLIENSVLFVDDDLTITDGTLHLEDNSSCIVNGKLTVGSAATKITNDVVCIEAVDVSTVFVGGALDSYRNVSATNPMIQLSGGSKISVGGDCDVSREGTGAGGVIDVDEESSFLARGTTDLLAHGGAIAADGSFLRVGNLSNVILNQVLFNTGGDLDLDAYASVLIENGSKLVVTDAAGASDARNSDDAAGALGIKLTAGSQAHLPAWAQNAGISVTGAGASEDYSCGGAADADYSGSETITDIGAGTPELCLLSKP
jgi:hypothetical protein